MARTVLCEAVEVRVPAKGLPLVAGLVGVIAPIVALSGLVPAVASPVLLAVGVMAALALLREDPGEVPMKRRTLRLLAWSYAIKTVLVGILWLVAPEIPQQALAHARRAWASVID